MLFLSSLVSGRNARALGMQCTLLSLGHLFRLNWLADSTCPSPLSLMHRAAQTSSPEGCLPSGRTPGSPEGWDQWPQSASPQQLGWGLTFSEKIADPAPSVIFPSGNMSQASHPPGLYPSQWRFHWGVLLSLLLATAEPQPPIFFFMNFSRSIAILLTNKNYVHWGSVMLFFKVYNMMV